MNTYTTSVGSYPPNYADYAVTVTDPTTGCTSDPSSNVVMEVVPGPSAPTITGNAGVCVPGSTTLTGVTPCGSCTYQWYMNGTAISGANSLTYTYTAALGSNNFTFQVTQPGTVCNATSAPFTVTGKDCCDPALTFQSNPYTTIGGSGTLSGAISAGNYYLSSPTNIVHITANTTITNAIILIDPSTQIIVDPGMILSITKSHLFSCKMWKGILLNDVSSSVEIFNSLIEDADNAVQVTDLNTINVFYNVYINKSVFNRNSTAIDIENSAIAGAGSPTPTATLPFYILGNVFCSIDMNSSTVSGYPYTWPTAATLMTPTGTTCDLNFSNLYNITSYPLAICKNAQDPVQAIYLNNVGTATGSGSSAVYDEVAIGDPNNKANENFFYFTFTGIHAKNSDLSVYNCTFFYMTWQNSTVTEGGEGIFAEADYNTQARIRIWNNGGAFSNRFYDFMTYYGYVRIDNYYDVTCDDAIFQGQWDFYPFPYFSYNAMLGQHYTEQIAYNIKLWNFYNLEIDHNTTTHISDPIVFDDTTDLSGVQHSGIVNITGNKLLGGCPGSTYSVPPSTLPYLVTLNAPGFIYKAITLTNHMTAGTATATGDVTISDNYISDAYNGIYVGNFNVQKVATKANTITMPDDPQAIAQYGIEYDQSSYPTHEINNNAITGETSTIAQQNLVKAVYLSGAGSFNTIACNDITDMGRHFDFENCTGRVTWEYNQMNISGTNTYTSKGFVLDGSVIGPQGSTAAASGNQWIGTWSSGYNTYVAGGASPASSDLYVDATSAPEDPVYNGAAPGNTAYAAPSTIVSSAAAQPNCPMPKRSHSLVTPAIIAAEQGYEVYPNPTSDGLLKVTQARIDNGPMNVQVLDARGQTVYSGVLQFANGTASLAPGNLASGLYLLHLRDNSGKYYTMRFVVDRQ